MMQTYGIAVRGRDVAANSSDVTLVRTSVGVDQIHATFDSAEWLDFPVRVSFGNGETLVTVPMEVTASTDGEWAAEGTCDVPWEALQELGALRITFQGTDDSGNHIITAKGAPLTVVEEGDVPEGSAPETAPTADEWQQAYAQATAAIAKAQELQSSLQQSVDGLVEQIDSIDISTVSVPVATNETVGTVKPDGTSIIVDEDGTISTPEASGITREQSNVIANVQLLATKAFDTTFNEETGALETARLKLDAMPEDYDPGISEDDIGDGLRFNGDGKLETAMGFTSSDQSIVAASSVSGGTRMYDLKHTSAPTGDTVAGQNQDLKAYPGGDVFVPFVARNASGHIVQLTNTKVTLPGVNKGLSTNTEDGKTYVGHSSTSSMPSTQYQHNYMTPGSTLPVTYAASVDDYGHLTGGSHFMLHVPSIGDGLSDSVSESGAHTISVNVESLGAITTKTTQGPAYGPLVSVTAEGHAEQVGTPTPSDPKEIVVVRGHEVTGKTGRYVDLVVTADGKTTTTPIPLPSRGWVGSLPDGTHDALSIDGAGRVTWELATAMTNAAATEGVTGTVGVDVLSTTGEIADGATVLYKTTPTTEAMGYVDLPDIPDGAVVSMPELEGLGVESWTSDAVADYANAVAGKVDTNGVDITPTSVTATGAVKGNSVSDSVGSLADLRDSVSRESGTITFTPYSGFTALNVSSKSFGPLTVVSIEVFTSTPRPAGEVKVGTVSGPFVQGLGAGRIMVPDTGVYEGVFQIAASGEVRFFSSTDDANAFWGMAVLLA